MINDQSKVFVEQEEGLKKQVDYLTAKMKEYREKSKDVESLRLENDNLKIRAQASTSLEANVKTMMNEIEHLRTENKGLKTKNQVLITENGTIF